MSCKSLPWLLSLLITITHAQNLASAGMTGGDFKQDPCSEMVRGFCTIVDAVLDGTVYNTTVTKTHKMCIDTCKAQPMCNSTNYMYAARDGNQCQLNSLCNDGDFGELIGKPGWVYTPRKQQQVGTFN